MIELNRIAFKNFIQFLFWLRRVLQKSSNLCWVIKVENHCCSKPYSWTMMCMLNWDLGSSSSHIHFSIWACLLRCAQDTFNYSKVKTFIIRSIDYTVLTVFNYKLKLRHFKMDQSKQDRYIAIYFLLRWSSFCYAYCCDFAQNIFRSPKTRIK